MRKLLYIVNPISGTSNKPVLKEIIKKQTTAAGVDFKIFPSVADGNYSFLDQAIVQNKFTDIVIAGGDGTVNAAINSLRKHHLPFGIIPSGSGNGLALCAGIPKLPAAAINCILTGKQKWVDAFLINERFACMLCGLGFDAQVAHDFAKGTKRGLMSYIQKVMKQFFVSSTYPFIVTLDNTKLDVEAYFISIANSNQFGNNFTIAPQASLTDGLLDIVIMTKQSKINVLIQAIRQVAGFNQLKKIEAIHDKMSVMYFQTKKINISNPQQAPLHIDGEPAESAENLEIKILPQSFQLIFPY